MTLPRMVAFALIVGCLGCEKHPAKATSPTLPSVRPALQGAVYWIRGEPVRGEVTVELLDADGRVLKSKFLSSDRFAMTVPDPAVRLRAYCHDPRPGGSRVSFSVVELDLADLSPDQEASLVLRSDSHGSVSARILLANEPVIEIESFELERLTDSAENPSVYLGPIRCSPAGELKFPALAPGSYRLQIESLTSLPLEQAFEVRAGEHVDLGDVHLTPASPIQGTVLSEEGAPLEGISLLAELSQRWWREEIDPQRGLLGVTRPDGTFSCSPSHTGLWLVKPGYEPRELLDDSGQPNAGRVHLRPLVPVHLGNIHASMVQWHLRIVEEPSQGQDPGRRVDINHYFPLGDGVSLDPVPGRRYDAQIFLPRGRWQLVAWTSSPTAGQLARGDYYRMRELELTASDTEGEVDFLARPGEFRSVPSKASAAAKRLTVGGVEFVFIEGGEVKMGSPLSEIGRQQEESLEVVSIPHGYWIARTEVTEGLFERVMGLEPPLKEGPEIADRPERAASYLDWNVAMHFCERFQEQYARDIPEGLVARLPLEAEWEHACRAGSDGAFSFGPDWPRLTEFAWFRDNQGQWRDNPHDVGLKKPGPAPWELFDLHGNVAEWCLDRVPAPDWRPADEKYQSWRVLRGGEWSSTLDDCRCASRQLLRPIDSDSGTGMRLVLGVPIEKQ
ncbi:MAG: formylglycine-generating enzyme family protein [Planctomycetota bacterium]